MTIELRAQLSHEEAPTEAIEQLLSSLGSFSNVMTEPPPNVAVSHYNLMGTVLMVRVHCKREHYWQVFMAVTDEIGSRSVSHSHRRIRMKL